MPKIKGRAEQPALDRNPLWYQEAVIYQLHVRAFCDGNADGIGDFRGLTQKLDYLQDLGVTALWLLPFYPSPLRDDGYDIADYTKIHPDYGTLQDFKTFLREAHRRGLRVITELVINHTSDQHPWFQRARRAAPGSRERDFYVWSDSSERYSEARIIFRDFEPSNWAWDPIARAYYWHRFYSHQPDLNFDNPEVRKAVLGLLDFWFDMGVDGLRLDAIPYLYEREGTDCENLPETHAYLKELRAHVDRKHDDRMLLAEANQWPEDAVEYFGDGDECHMAFHFPVMPRLFMAVRMEDRFPIIEILEQTPPIPESCQWAVFLRNHDELTLEMVTDEDRDYMYRVYATDPRARINLGIRRRLAPLLGNSRRKIELLNSLLFSLPGTPVIYYGDEIGMGDNIYLGDRNGVRTPMQWNADRNAGFSKGNPQRLYLPIIIDPEHHYESINVETQQENSGSLLWWMKRMLVLRKQHASFSKGSIEFLLPENRRVLVFLRRLGDEIILVVANLSRFVNYAELDLSAFNGMTPVELFGQNPFPKIGELPYFIILGPHSFYWFKLEAAPSADAQAPSERVLPKLEVNRDWQELFEDRGRRALERALPQHLNASRWFGGKAGRLRSTRVGEAISISFDGATAYLVSVEATYADAPPESYLLPVAFASGERANEIEQAAASAKIADLRISSDGTDGFLYDALRDSRFCTALLHAIAGRKRFRGRRGELVGVPSKRFKKLAAEDAGPLTPAPVQREQSNTSVTFGDKLILKIFRRMTEGTNPDLEIGRFLTEQTSFSHTPPLAGALEYRPEKGEPFTVGILQGLVPNEGDAWAYTLEVLEDFHEWALTNEGPPELPASQPLADLVRSDTPEAAKRIIGAYLPAAEQLGRCTAELHVAMASGTNDPAFAPEAFTPQYRRSIYQSLRSNAEKALRLLQDRLSSLPEEHRASARDLLGRKSVIQERFRSIVDAKVGALRTRCHGDYHLGQVLYTGKDFVIIDFEGEPARSIAQRRIKRSPITDVAGMLRSFNYASVFSLQRARIRPEDVATLEVWTRYWNLWTNVVFLKSYLETAGNAPFVPKSDEELRLLLDLYLLEKGLYELTYELNNRPGWVNVPIRGILGLLN